MCVVNDTKNESPWDHHPFWEKGYDDSLKDLFILSSLFLVISHATVRYPVSKI